MRCPFSLRSRWLACVQQRLREGRTATVHRLPLVLAPTHRPALKVAPQAPHSNSTPSERSRALRIPWKDPALCSHPVTREPA